MVGPLSTSPGSHRFLLVAIGKFTKWIEAKPVTNAEADIAIKFISGIIHRFRVPHNIIIDSGSNFMADTFKEFYHKRRIQIDYSSVSHPQSNEQVEHANGLTMQGLKPRLITPLGQAKGKWVDELPSVLWSLRTTPNRSIGYTPFFMVYGAEAVLPSDIEYDSPRVRGYEEEDAEESWKDDINAKEEARLLALKRIVVYQQKLRQYQGRRIWVREFNVGDLVLRLKQKQ